MFSTPDFIVVGPKKTGTTWLYIQLNNIKGIRVPPFKELGFFYDADEQYKARSLKKSLRLYMETKKGGVEIDASNFEKSTRLKIEQIKQSQKEKRRRNFMVTWKQGKYLWSIFFYLVPRGFTFFHLYLYTRLFGKKGNEITGDISPEYFTLKRDVIRKIKENFPKAKIIFIIRDPVEREWSQIKMTFYENKGETVGMNLDEHLAKPHLDSDYKSAFENWESCFDQKQILYLFYDELKEDPARFMERVLQFLGCDTAVAQVNPARVAEGIKLEPEESVKAQLVANNLPQYHYLAAKFGASSPPASWLKSVLK
jgi:hypothetical protein